MQRDGHDNQAGTSGEEPRTQTAEDEILQRAERIEQPESVVVDHPPPHPDYPRYRIEPGSRVNLRDLDPGDTEQYRGKKDASGELKRVRKRLQELQARLYAENRQSLLIVLQAIDAGGKDGTIRHVFRGVNPQGCRVWSFKQPSSEEAAHDFLWRYHVHTPPRGMLTIFNRSHYEDVLVVRVKQLAPETVWRQRYAMINDFEQMLTLNGTTILKFFLHISKDEQKKRMEARLENPQKRWKFNRADLEDRALWSSYREAFEDAINNCSTAYAPWYVVPANHKWFRNLVVARTIADTLEAMNPRYPTAEIDNPEEIEIPS